MRVFGQSFDGIGNFLGRFNVLAHAIRLPRDGFASALHQLNHFVGPLIHFTGRIGVIAYLLFNLADRVFHAADVFGDGVRAKRQLAGGVGDLGHDFDQLLVAVGNAPAGVHYLASDIRGLLQDFAQLVHHAVEGATEIVHASGFRDSAGKIAFGDFCGSAGDIIERTRKRFLEIARKRESKRCQYGDH
ncbi:hypothetical protein D3C81_1226670 [compost metagenome]